MTALREKIFESMKTYVKQLNLKNAKVLDVGVAGDSLRPDGKPGGNWKFWGEDNEYKTLDVHEQFKPDFVGDISKKTPFEDNAWDLVICSQVLEHIWDYKGALAEIYRITKEYAIIDMPWSWPHHPEEEFGDYWRFSTQAMEKLLKEVGFKNVEVENKHFLTIALAKK